ncbi:MAG: PD40 domain-containing protein [Ignavibacteriae bacterium]|nr:PD40 domain-containing protein [Ignavibacteriota bacterium]
MYIRTFIILSILLLFNSTHLIAQTEKYWEDNVRIINLRPPLNLDDIDYAPYISQDGKYLLFSTKREGNFYNDNEADFSHDVWIAIKTKPEDSTFSHIFNISPPYKANSLINTIRNEGSVCISNDNKVLYFTGCNRKDGRGSCDIYLAFIQIENDSLIIGNIYNLGTQVNTRNFESSPSISPDNLKLFYTKSDISGRTVSMFEYLYNQLFEGKPQQDIWYCEFDTNQKVWLPGKPLTQINTNEIEMAPYICPDNKTLIFSSNGRKDGFGGLDFYYTVLDSNGEWSEPKNLGRPFNTSDDDLGISFTGKGDIAYFSSKRDDIEGEQGDYDIYMAYLKEPLFNEVRTISWQQFSDANVMIGIYNSTGNQENSINKGLQKSGRHSFHWDCLDSKGNNLPSGFYQYKITIGNEIPELPRVLRIK